MNITRLYSDESGDSHFENIEIELNDFGDIGKLSEKYPVKDIIFRETGGDYDYDFHNAPQKQFIILLDGVIEIETSLGETRHFRSGEILLAEDISGKGHKTKSVDGKLRRSIFVTLGENDVKIK
ncbi:MAG: hypothetical protein R3250_09080 [Melioribacteraceae bacterium]|nr:hypothetical protein [Melioribacteraceae bacterium]